MADFFSTVKLKAKSANTLKSYEGKDTRFLNWLSSEEPSCWDEGVPEVIIERIISGMKCSVGAGALERKILLMSIEL